MTTLTDMQWFAIQAHPTAEAVAEFSLRSMSFETLLPLVRRPLRHAARTARLVVRALFPGYLFARFCAADSLRAVTYSRGVVRVVGTGDRPIPVEEAIIASIRARIGADGCVELIERGAQHRGSGCGSHPVCSLAGPVFSSASYDAIFPDVVPLKEPTFCREVERGAWRKTCCVNSPLHAHAT